MRVYIYLTVPDIDLFASMFGQSSKWLNHKDGQFSAPSFKLYSPFLDGHQWSRFMAWNRFMTSLPVEFSDLTSRRPLALFCVPRHHILHVKVQRKFSSSHFPQFHPHPHKCRLTHWDKQKVGLLGLLAMPLKALSLLTIFLRWILLCSPDYTNLTSAQSVK